MANLFNTIYTGTLAKYNSASKEANALYMVYDETTKVKSIYHGTTKVAGDFIIVNGGAPETPEQGVIYYISAFVKETGKEGKPFVGFYNGTAWVALSDSARFDSLDERVSDVEDAIVINGNTVEGSIGEAVETLIGDENVEGSVKEQVATAKSEIVGELKEGDSETLAAINTELDAIDTTLGGIKLESVTPTDENVKEEYKLVNGDGDIAGSAHIKVYKDSSLKSAEFVTEKPAEEEGGEPVKGNFLKLVYILNTGAEDTVYVDMSNVITESEVKNGIAVDITDKKLYVKLDDDTEDFLTVGANGLKLSGVQDAIDAAVEAKNVSAEGDDYVSASAADNKVTVAATDSTKASLALADTAVQTASGETGDDALVTASVNDKDVTVASTEKLQNAVAAAETAIQSVSEETEGQEVTVSTSDKAVTVGVTKATYTQATFEETGKLKTDGVLSENGLVDSSVMKNYVADEIAKNAIYWIEL